jgi:hypothetical protein
MMMPWPGNPGEEWSSSSVRSRSSGRDFKIIYNPSSRKKKRTAWHGAKAKIRALELDVKEEYRRSELDVKLAIVSAEDAAGCGLDLCTGFDANNPCNVKCIGLMMQDDIARATWCFELLYQGVQLRCV